MPTPETMNSHQRDNSGHQAGSEQFHCKSYSDGMKIIPGVLPLGCKAHPSQLAKSLPIMPCLHQTACRILHLFIKV